MLLKQHMASRVFAPFHSFPSYFFPSLPCVIPQHNRRSAKHFLHVDFVVAYHSLLCDLPCAILERTWEKIFECWIRIKRVFQLLQIHVEDVCPHYSNHMMNRGRQSKTAGMCLRWCVCVCVRVWCDVCLWCCMRWKKILHWVQSKKVARVSSGSDVRFACKPTHSKNKNIHTCVNNWTQPHRKWDVIESSPQVRQSNTNEIPSDDLWWLSKAWHAWHVGHVWSRNSWKTLPNT